MVGGFPSRMLSCLLPVTNRLKDSDAVAPCRTTRASLAATDRVLILGRRDVCWGFERTRTKRL